jgi:hypothetical protein
MIACTYLKGAFTIDFVSIFPFYAFTTGSGAAGRSNSFIRFLRMARLSRIFRASKMVGMIKYFASSDSMEKLQNFLSMYQGITRLCGTLFIVFILAHFTACMWFFFARLDEFQPDTWVAKGEY